MYNMKVDINTKLYANCRYRIQLEFASSKTYIIGLKTQAQRNLYMNKRETTLLENCGTL